jgi:hypothetical protein
MEMNNLLSLADTDALAASGVLNTTIIDAMQGGVDSLFDSIDSEINSVTDALYGANGVYETMYGADGVYNIISDGINALASSTTDISTSVEDLNLSIDRLSDTISELKSTIGPTIGTYIKSMVDSGEWSIEDLSDDMKALAGFDSGGYTGEWGRNGALAMLHEKELVLNQADTANILAAVDIVRQLSGIIGSLSGFMTDNALQSLNGGIAAKLSNEYSRNQPLEQSVHIEANFPNVTDRNEIQEAIDNLISLAEQKANLK